MPPSPLQHTLYIWPQGLFPRRVAYQLLASKICTSPSSLLAGKTVIPNLSLSIITIDPATFAWTSADATKPKPDGKSMPCLQISDPSSPESPPQYINESNSIMLYIESHLSNSRARLISENPIQRAQAEDMMLLINEVALWSGIWGRHAHEKTLMWSGMTKEELSMGAADDGLRMMRKCLLKLQEWAGDDLRKTGWLTPGVEGRPGLADCALLGWSRYFEVAYKLKAFEMEGLERLHEWAARMMQVDWVREYEGDERVVHPDFLVQVS